MGRESPGGRAARRLLRSRGRPISGVSSPSGARIYKNGKSEKERGREETTTLGVLRRLMKSQDLDNQKKKEGRGNKKKGCQAEDWGNDLPSLIKSAMKSKERWQRKKNGRPVEKDRL